MRRFRFRLQQVLDWQIKVCHMEEEELRLRRLAVVATGERMASLQAFSLATEQQSLSVAYLAASDLKALARYRARVIKDARALAQERQARQVAVEEQQRKLLDERHRLRLLEKIRERALEEYTAEAARELETLALESHLSKWVTERRRELEAR